MKLVAKPTIEHVDRYEIADEVNILRDICHNSAAASGWWHDLKSGELIVPNVGEKLMLIVSEVAEAMEGDRKNKIDEHLPHRKSVEVELADALIRIFDLCGRLDLDIGGAMYEKLVYNSKRADHKPENRAKSDGKKY